jgi:hypothetical protein
MTAARSACLVHRLEIRDGRTVRELAHGMGRRVGSPEDDDIPAGAVVDVSRSESSGSE